MSKNTQSCSYWNYRVVRHAFEDSDETELRIHEVYYDEDNSIVTSTVDGMAAMGDTVEELEQDLQHMLHALKKPILDYTEMP